ncbi:unnamed protein product [Microthlaspi erraticum]|uniref:Uncharacterized protein n=1 Tax=Microthlaspi erraticum TaxID=1685480 RepID=A0A6D2LEY7_9BRAS|nr:unnamed protein product [Microthlaspi erraticum]
MSSSSSSVSDQLRHPFVFDELTKRFCKKELLARVIHLWEARNTKKEGLLMGYELLLIDQKYELAMLHQGQGSHTHFDEEEEEEEPQARSSDVNPVEWSAPDGRLPSPDHDLASQFFGGH